MSQPEAPFQLLNTKQEAAVVLSVIASGTAVESLEQIIFQHSTSIGVRRYTADRHKLKRESVMVNTPQVMPCSRPHESMASNIGKTGKGVVEATDTTSIICDAGVFVPSSAQTAVLRFVSR